MYSFTDAEWFEYELSCNGLTDRLVKTHQEAAASSFLDCIVFQPDRESGKLDVYLVGKRDGVFVEYVCWVAEEFVDDADLIYTVIEYILGAFKGPNCVADNLLVLNPHLNFFSYPKEEYPEIYNAMKI